MYLQNLIWKDAVVKQLKNNEKLTRKSGHF